MELIREDYLKQIRPYYNLDFIKVITGIRRSGKSIILRQIMSELKTSGIKEKEIIYLNFEDVSLSFITSFEDLDSYIKKRICSDRKYYLFFDEIQHVNEFEKALASLKATTNCSIFVTGSNSKLLSGDLASLLVGRTVEFCIMPFSYKESIDYLNLNHIKIPDDFFFDYLKYGGFPQRFQLHTETAINQYIRDIYNGIVEKDIMRRNSDIERYKFMSIASYVLAMCGTEFSAYDVANYYNTNNSRNHKDIERKTIYNYLERMEKAFLISRVKRYDISGKKELLTIEKHYAMDNGLRIINTNGQDYQISFFLENVMYNELIRQGFQVYVGKTYKGEIDFVITKNNKKGYLQITYLLASKETIDREFGAFKPISDNSVKYVLSLDKIDLSREGIVHLNIEDFLLGKKEIVLM